MPDPMTAANRVRALPENAPEDRVPAAAEEWQNGWRWGWRYAIEAAKRALCGDGCGYPSCWHPELGCGRQAPAALDGGQPDTPVPTRVCGWCANGDCVNCDWDEHEPPERCAHICYPPREEPTSV